MALSDPKVSPGTPFIKAVDMEGGKARLLVALAGPRTKGAFEEACALFSQEARRANSKLPGSGSTGFQPPQNKPLPQAELFQLFGEAAVKSFALSLLAADVQSQCDNFASTAGSGVSEEETPVQLVGRARLLDLRLDAFKPGQPHVLEVEADLRPRVLFSAPYRGLRVPVASSARLDADGLGAWARSAAALRRAQQVRLSIRRRFQQLQSAPAGYCAQEGDVLSATLQGHLVLPDGSQGEALQDSQQVQLHLTADSVDGDALHPDMVQQLLGVQAGESRQVAVRLRPNLEKDGSAGTQDNNQEALLTVRVLAVQRALLPSWDDGLAERLRRGLTLRRLEEDVQRIVEGEHISAALKVRNEAIAAALLSCVQVSKIPEALVEEEIQAKFENMLEECREQGYSPERLERLASSESYEAFRQRVHQVMERSVKLALVLEEVAHREEISISDKEIQDQLRILQEQSGGERKEGDFNAEQAVEETRSVLLRKKLFDLLASCMQIEYQP